MNRRKKCVFLFVFLVFLIIGLIGYGCFRQEKSLAVVSSIQEEKIVFFYRDDCPDCQKVFLQVYLWDLLHQDIQFINLNQEENWRFLSQYNVYSVPTFIYRDHTYAGTNRQAIGDFLEKRSDE
ncbi:thioredoxin family protein [Enterococcus sp. AN402]|uniref:thioredoxin family protein n=1 Tax=Enterococcus sp. AN402 TaxID=3151386 RepID=UPI00345894F8